jgi:hypothetical protein
MFDRDIRAALRESLRRSHSSEPTCAIVDELALCDSVSRVDVAVINGAMHAYEIKSDRDSLSRLPFQQETYAKCFDTVTAVIGSKHMKHIASAIPQWWGILEATSTTLGSIAFVVHREPGINSKVNPAELIKLLWKQELINILAVNDESKSKLNRQSRQNLRDAVVASLTPTELAKQVREKIKSRGDWRAGPTPFRCDDSSQSFSKSQSSRKAHRDWLLSQKSHRPQH